MLLHGIRKSVVCRRFLVGRRRGGGRQGLRVGRQDDLQHDRGAQYHRGGAGGGERRRRIRDTFSAGVIVGAALLNAADGVGRKIDKLRREREDENTTGRFLLRLCAIVAVYG